MNNRQINRLKYNQIMLNGKKTKTSIFLEQAILEELKISQKKLEQFSFVNAYIGDLNNERVGEFLYLLFYSPEPITFGDFCTTYVDKIVEEYDYEGYTVLVFEFPVKHIVSWKLFKEGKFSQFPIEYRELFTKQPSIEDKALGLKFSYQYSVFNRTADLKRYWEKNLEMYIPQNIELENVNLLEEILDMDALELMEQIKESARPINTYTMSAGNMKEFSIKEGEEELFSIDCNREIYIKDCGDYTNIKHLGANTIKNKYINTIKHEPC